MVEDAISELDSDAPVEVVPTDPVGGDELPETMAYPTERIDKIREGFNNPGADVNDG